MPKRAEPDILAISENGGAWHFETEDECVQAFAVNMEALERHELFTWRNEEWVPDHELKLRVRRRAFYESR